MKEAIRAEAERIGFDQVGFAPAAPPAHVAEYLDWIGRGLHGEMGYMAREDAVRRRADPAEALDGCRSIVVVSLLYGPGESDPRAGDLGGGPPAAVVARYAAGRDYHDVFEERLDELADAIRALAPGVRTKRYVDYGPVLERDHAQRAGLGWIGKNTMLIHPELGSYLMLGELLTDLDLEPDPPFTADRCGSCERCIVACPTDAILPGRAIDARRCISYLTIELRGAIPEDLRPAIGARVFGCDICQEVCPWNADAPTPAEHPFAPTIAPHVAHLPAPSSAPSPAHAGQPVPPADMLTWAEEVRALDDDTFRRRYRGSALGRPGRAGLLRNLAVGLGNVGGPEARPVLEALASDESDLVREHAAWAIARLESRGHGRAVILN